MGETGQNLVAGARQTLQLAPRQLQGLRLLAKSLPELRAEIFHEMDANPAIEDFDHSLETPLSEVEHESEKLSESDYPEEDFEPGGNVDEEAVERRQAFFDNQVKAETLQDHLLAQLPLSDLPRETWPLVEVLVGDLDEKGYYKGSLPDIAMAFGKSEAEIRAVLSEIMAFDPLGCGARDVRECLLAQVDVVADPATRENVRRIIDVHLDDLAAGRLEKIARALGIDLSACRAAVQAIQSLDGRPGRQYASERERVEYVNPEIHAEKVDGRWIARTDERSLPEIRLSKKFIAMLSDPAQSEETKAYVRERIAAAEAFREAIVRRRQTIQSIADLIFERQQAFFEKGFGALKPLTEQEVAKAVGVHGTTVSRTVRDKYAETPFGTIELRRFFVTGIKTSDGETIAQDAVLTALAKLVKEEDKENPLSDERLAEQLKEAGYPVARRTVAKYRDRLGIPGTSARRLRGDAL